MQAGSSLRKKLGESLVSVQKYDKPLSEATTSSLEALKAFSLGDMKHQSFDELAALPLYQHAVELDPNFAMAYARLGTVYNNLGQSELSETNRQKAFELRDRASEHEKLYIMSHLLRRLRTTRQGHHRPRTLQADLSAGFDSL